MSTRTAIGLLLTAAIVLGVVAGNALFRVLTGG
jgi:hypothetical protein